MRGAARRGRLRRRRGAAVRAPELLLLGALLHDIGKGAAGRPLRGRRALRAASFGGRIGLDAHAVDVVSRGSCDTTCCWPRPRPVATSPTRRRSSGSAASCDDTERLDLLYALTIGDSRATGPAAWSSAKAALVPPALPRDRRAARARASSARDSQPSDTPMLERHRAAAGGRPSSRWRGRRRDDGLARVHRGRAPTDRACSPRSPACSRSSASTSRERVGVRRPRDGMALEVYRGDRPLRSPRRRRRRRDFVSRCCAVRSTVTLPLRSSAGASASAVTGAARPGRPPVRRAWSTSTRRASATVVEVHAPDEVGLLARSPRCSPTSGSTSRSRSCRPRATGSSTSSTCATSTGAKPTDPLVLDRLRATLVARLTTDYVLPAPG